MIFLDFFTLEIQNCVFSTKNLYCKSWKTCVPKISFGCFCNSGVFRSSNRRVHFAFLPPDLLRHINFLHFIVRKKWHYLSKSSLLLGNFAKIDGCNQPFSKIDGCICTRHIPLKTPLCNITHIQQAAVQMQCNIASEMNLILQPSGSSKTRPNVV